MIPPWLALLLGCLGVLVLMIGIYLLGHHHGYWAGRGTRIEEIPGDPWRRPTVPRRSSWRCSSASASG